MLVIDHVHDDSVKIVDNASLGGSRNMNEGDVKMSASIQTYGGHTHMGATDNDYISQIKLRSDTTCNKSSAVDFWDSFGRVPEGWYSQTMSKFLSLKYLRISIKTGALGLSCSTH